MRVASVLDFFDKARVRRIARHFDVDDRGLKPEIAKRVAQSLAKRHDEHGAQLGWRGSLQWVVSALTRKEIIDFVRTMDWEDGRHQFTHKSGLYHLSVAELRGLLPLLCESLDPSGEVSLREVCTDARWAHCFEDLSEPFELEEEGDCEELLDEGSEELEEDEPLLEEAESEARDSAWRTEVMFVAGSGRELPPGLQPRHRPLFAHQQRAVDALRSWWRGADRGGVVCLPTGAGKTRVGVSLVLEQVARGGRVLWLAHRKELVDQAIAAILENGSALPKPFTVGRFERRPHQVGQPVDVVVGSIPTVAFQSKQLPNLRRLLATQERFDLVVVDECHHAAATSWKRVLKALLDSDACHKLLGLSATPTRTDDAELSELWRLFERIIHEEQPLRLIREGVLAQPHVSCVRTNQRFEADEHERTLYEQFDDLPASLVRRIADDEHRNALILDTYLRDHQRWGRTLLFAATVDHAHRLSEELRARGIRAAAVDNTTPVDERAGTLRALANGDLDVLVNVALFTEGTDVPAVETVFVGRPTTSRILFQQMVGRGLRGPAVGGSPRCDVVTFYDEVVGLMQEQLTSSFADEWQALEALGLDDAEPSEDEVELAPAAMTYQAPPDDAIERRIEALRQVLASGAGVREAVERSELPLAGWWQLDAEGRLHQLAVLEPERERIARRIHRLADLIEAGARTAPEEGWSDEGLHDEAAFDAFCTRALAAGIEPIFVSLDEAYPPSDLESLVTTLVDAPSNDEAAPPPPAPTAAATPWTDLAFRLDGLAEGEALIAIGGGELLTVRTAYLDAVDSVWQQHSALVPPAANDAVVEMFAGICVNLPAIASLPPDLARTLLRECVRLRSVPQPIDAATRPSLLEARTELRVVPRDRRAAALDVLHRTFFTTTHPDRDSFILDLLAF